MKRVILAGLAVLAATGCGTGISSRTCAALEQKSIDYYGVPESIETTESGHTLYRYPASMNHFAIEFSIDEDDGRCYREYHYTPPEAEVVFPSRLR